MTTDQHLDAVLHSLSENMTVAVSGERLARDLGISHSRILRLVDKLRAEGVEIQGEPFSGFRLTRVPDVLMPQALAGRLRTRDFGKEFHHLYSVDSTNAFAAGLLAAGRPAAHGAVVAAERQSAGRGRMGRTWVSVGGAGLYVSIILRPSIPSHLAPLLTLGAAVAAHDAVERTTGVEVDIKWPNDLLVRGRKVCGILSELQAELDRVRSLVVGLGVNVNHEAMPPEIAEIATSLRIESGRRESRIEVLAELLAAFERVYDRFVESGPASIIDAWTRASSFASGRVLEVDDGVRRIRGRTEGLNATGALRLREADGNIEEIYSGDVLDWE